MSLTTYSCSNCGRNQTLDRDDEVRRLTLDCPHCNDEHEFIHPLEVANTSI